MALLCFCFCLEFWGPNDASERGMTSWQGNVFTDSITCFRMLYFVAIPSLFVAAWSINDFGSGDLSNFLIPGAPVTKSLGNCSTEWYRNESDINIYVDSNSTHKVTATPDLQGIKVTCDDNTQVVQHKDCCPGYDIKDEHGNWPGWGIRVDMCQDCSHTFVSGQLLLVAQIMVCIFVVRMLLVKLVDCYIVWEKRRGTWLANMTNKCKTLNSSIQQWWTTVRHRYYAVLELLDGCDLVSDVTFLVGTLLWQHEWILAKMAAAVLHMSIGVLLYKAIIIREYQRHRTSPDGNHNHPNIRLMRMIKFMLGWSLYAISKLLGWLVCVFCLGADEASAKEPARHKSELFAIPFWNVISLWQSQSPKNHQDYHDSRAVWTSSIRLVEDIPQFSIVLLYINNIWTTEWFQSNEPPDPIPLTGIAWWSITLSGMLILRWSIAVLIPLLFRFIKAIGQCLYQIVVTCYEFVGSCCQFVSNRVCACYASWTTCLQQNADMINDEDASCKV